MDDYEILFARSARKELEKLPSRIQTRVLGSLESLKNDPRPGSSRKLVGSSNLWRLRVGDYRVVYAIDDERRVVDISAIRHRKDAYQ